MFLGVILSGAIFFEKKENIVLSHIWNLWNLSFLPIFKRSFCSNSQNLPISDTWHLAIGLHAQIDLLACAAHWAARVFLVWLLPRNHAAQ